MSNMTNNKCEKNKKSWMIPWVGTDRSEVVCVATSDGWEEVEDTVEVGAGVANVK